MTTPEDALSVADLLARGLLIRIEPDREGAASALGIAREHLVAAGLPGIDPVVVLAMALQACRSSLVAAGAAAGYEVNTSTGQSEHVLDPALAKAAAELGGMEVAIAAFAELRAVWALSEEDLDATVDGPHALEVASVAVVSIEGLL